MVEDYSEENLIAAQPEQWRSAAMAAVSARRIVLPKDAAIQPRLEEQFQLRFGPTTFGTKGQGYFARRE